MSSESVLLAAVGPGLEPRSRPHMCGPKIIG